MGDRAKAERQIAILKESSKEGSVTIDGIGIIYCGLGDMDSFYEYAFRALDFQFLSVSTIRYSPLVAKAREDPRMSKLLLQKYARTFANKSETA